MICWMQSDCLDQHAITNSAKRIEPKSEMPSYRLKFPLFSTRTEKDTAWDGYTMNFWTVGFRWITSVFNELWTSLHCLANVQKRSTILTKATLVKLRTILSIGISVPKSRCKSGQQMYHNSIFLGGKCYISSILDMNTNEIISYNLSTSLNMEEIKNMLNKAFERFPFVQGLVIHSDQGWQYQHAFYRGELQNTESFNPCPERVTAMTIAWWKPSSADWKMKCSMDLRRIITPLKPSQRRLPSILTITITAESKLKQNGCLPLSSGKHPW